MWWIQIGAVWAIFICLGGKLFLKKEKYSTGELVYLFLNLLIWPLTMILFLYGIVISIRHKKEEGEGHSDNDS